MNSNILVKVVILFAIGIAIVEGLPQKGWDYFKGSELGAEIYSLSGGKDNLSGLLRGPLDSASNVNLTNTGIVEWTNSQRATQGLGPLRDNMTLRKAAENKLNDMFEKQYFEHESPDGKMPSDVIKAVGYSYIVVGENLALGNFLSDAVLVQAWMDSPGHRANILNINYQEIGTATRKGMFEGKEVWLAVQEFGAPLSACPTTANGAKLKIDSNREQLATMQSDLQRKKAEIEANRYESETEYDRAVASYNSLVEKSNKLSSETQELVEQYNDSVNDFNRCLESNS